MAKASDLRHLGVGCPTLMLAETASVKFNATTNRSLDILWNILGRNLHVSWQVIPIIAGR